MVEFEAPVTGGLEEAISYRQAGGEGIQRRGRL